MNITHIPVARRAIAAAALAALAGAAAAAPLYSVTRIAPHDTAHRAYIEAVALNQVGGATGTDLTNHHPFRWSAASGIEWLEDLPGGDAYARTWDINDAGVVVGFGRIKGSDYEGEIVSRAVAWLPGDPKAHDLEAGQNPKAHHQWEGYAYSINNAGQISGVSGRIQGVRPFILDPTTGTPQLLGQVLYPYYINESGATAGSGPYDPVTGGTINQYRTPDGHRVDLPRGVSASALNNLGQIAGANNEFQAIVWSEAGGVVVLPSLDGMPRCEARGLNDAGVAIGTCYYWDDRPHAVLWTPDGAGSYTAQDVRDLVPPDPRRPLGCVARPAGGTQYCYGEVGAAIDNAGRLLVNEHTSRQRSVIDSEPLLLTPPASR